MAVNNDILICLSLIERVLPMLKENTRETIKKASLEQINRNLENALSKLVPYCKEAVILTPIMEMIELIKVIKQDDTFVETDNETKKVLVLKTKAALGPLYVFAGKFYIENEFTYSLGLNDLLKRIVDMCLSSEFYFGYDELLRSEGAI